MDIKFNSFLYPPKTDSHSVNDDVILKIVINFLLCIMEYYENLDVEYFNKVLTCIINI